MLPSFLLAGDIFLHHLLTGRRRPLLASCKLTFRCNLRCRQCPFAGRPGPDPTYAQVTALLDRLRARGDRMVIFEGGEPLLWQDGGRAFRDVADYARARFAVTGVTTNGTLPLDVPTDILWVSLDGLSDTHNRLRGATIFDRVIENIRRSKHPRLYAHLTANAENHRELPDLVRFLSPLVKGITVQFYYPYGADDSLFLDWPDRRALLAALLDLKRQSFPILNSPPALRALMANTWRCHPWRIDCAEPGGSVQEPITEAEGFRGSVQEPITEAEGLRGSVQGPKTEAKGLRGSVQEPITVAEGLRGPVQEPITEAEGFRGPVQGPLTEPEGFRLWQGCYVSGRGPVDCASCGFSPYTEMSLAFQGNPQAILAGMRIFGV